MENDEYKENIIIGESEERFDNIFKLDYPGQKINRNVEFEKWKNVNSKKYGKNYRIFKCLLDNLLFITTNQECKSFPFYLSVCPKCKNPICYFCSRFKKYSFFNGDCCLRRRIYCMFFQDGLRLIKPYNEVYITTFEKSFRIFIIPVYNLFYFLKELHGFLFYKLSLKNAKPHSNGSLEIYENHIGGQGYFVLHLFAGINILFGITISIPFILLDIYSTIFILIISVPFKLYPLKYILGIFFNE